MTSTYYIILSLSMTSRPLDLHFFYIKYHSIAISRSIYILSIILSLSVTSTFHLSSIILSLSVISTFHLSFYLCQYHLLLSIILSLLSETRRVRPARLHNHKGKTFCIKAETPNKKYNTIILSVSEKSRPTFHFPFYLCQ